MVDPAVGGRVLRMCARRLLLTPVLAALAACATAPRPAAPASGVDLAVCTMSVSNAPAADSRGRILGFSPFVEIREVTLARAPVAACLSSGFGPRPGGAQNFHNGVDLYTRMPAPVWAAGDGVVAAATRLRGYGLTILIRHGRGIETRYAHLSEFAAGVQAGARVRAGQIIGRTGETGNATAVHLHYEILIDGRAVNPITVTR
jgi:murein DD-endopeptidase MepM/ murein hydrolase activator NlpD